MECGPGATDCYLMREQMCRLVMVLLFPVVLACSGEGLKGDEGRNGFPAVSRALSLQLSPRTDIDSAQVLFFRPSGDTDTLIYREVIGEMKSGGVHSFLFHLPAGEYSVWIYGNVATERIVSKPPFSSDDIYLDYSRGEQPGMLCYGRKSLKAGADTALLSGILILSSAVELTVRDVPAGIGQIKVQLLNTSAGLTLTKSYLKEAADPPIEVSWKEVRADSTYAQILYCLPAVGQNRYTTVQVECLNTAGSVVYSGTSAPFEARPGYNWKLSCSFGATKSAPGDKGNGKLIFQWETD